MVLEVTMERITRFILGPVFVLGGLWFVAMPFAFASMSFGDRVSPPTWDDYLGEVFRVGVSSLGMGLLLVVGGLYLAVSRDKPGPGSGANRPVDQ